MREKHENYLLADAQVLGSNIEMSIVTLGGLVRDIALTEEVRKYHDSYQMLTLMTLFKKYSDRFDKISYVNEEGIEEAVDERRQVP